jgi:hypothetical protein
MRRRHSANFTVYTTGGTGSYRSYAKAEAAARWVAEETGESVRFVNDSSGQSWDVSAGRVSEHSSHF